MLVFILFYLLLYGGLNGYLYRTIISGLGHHSWPVAAGLVLLVLAPLLARVFEGKTRAGWLSLVAVSGYNWMGISFIFAVVALGADLLQVLFPGWSDAAALPWVLGGTLLVSLHGFREARAVRVRRVRVRSPKLTVSDDKPFRVVQISDLHLGFGTSFRHIRRVLDKVAGLEPDLLVSTGDLFDSDLENLDRYVDLLGAMKPSHGKIAVTGNHEVYAGLGRAMERIEESGFRILRGESVELVPGLYAAGVDDPEALSDTTSREEETKAFATVPDEAFVMLLKHRPEISEGLMDDFDLQLSGHTHGGQIFPFLYLTRLQYRARHGLSKVGEKAYLYVSRGTDAWGPKMRVFAPPEITVFEFSRGENLGVEMSPVS